MTTSDDSAAGFSVLIKWNGNWSGEDMCILLNYGMLESLHLIWFWLFKSRVSLDVWKNTARVLCINLIPVHSSSSWLHTMVFFRYSPHSKAQTFQIMSMSFRILNHPFVVRENQRGVPDVRCDPHFTIQKFDITFNRPPDCCFLRFSDVRRCLYPMLCVLIRIMMRRLRLLKTFPLLLTFERLSERNGGVLSPKLMLLNPFFA